MERVDSRKHWEINTMDDLLLALEKLDESDFVAEMSDSYALTCAEIREVSKQRAEVIRQAKEKGIINDEWRRK